MRIKGQDSGKLRISGTTDVNSGGLLVGLLACMTVLSILLVYPSISFLYSTLGGTGVVAAVLLVAIGCGLFMARFRSLELLVEEGSVQRRTGLWGEWQRWDLGTGDEILVTCRKQEYLDNRGSRRTTELWGAALRVKSETVTLFENFDAYLEARTVAEKMAKCLGLPLQDRTSGEAVSISPDGLDLPLAERLSCYPQLRLPAVNLPADSNLQESREGGVSSYRWRLGLVFAILAALIVDLGVWMVVLQFQVVVPPPLMVGFCLAVLLLVLAIQFCVQVQPDRVVYRLELRGIPFYSTHLKRSELEEIHIHSGLTGPVLQLVSDRSILSLRAYSGSAERQELGWLAFQIQQRLLAGK